MHSLRVALFVLLQLVVAEEFSNMGHATPEAIALMKKEAVSAINGCSTWTKQKASSPTGCKTSNH